MTLGEARQSTPAVSKTLNPEWNVGFDLPIEGLQSLILEAVCWDKDRVGKDYLGEFDIALEDVFQDGKHEQMVGQISFPAINRVLTLHSRNGTL